MFGGGLLGGLAAGFIGAGLFGMLFGHGFMGGMGGFASILGLLLQIGLVVIVARLAWAWWQRRQAAGDGWRPVAPRQLSTAGRLPAASPGSAAAQRRLAPAGEPIEMTPDDFDAFEKLLATSRPLTARRTSARCVRASTPEMLSYFSDELAQNASRGVVNQISDVKLLQGDLSEAWREGNDEYATVAMRYSLNDQIVDARPAAWSRRSRPRPPSSGPSAAPRRPVGALGDPADLIVRTQSDAMAGPKARPFCFQL